VVTFNKTIFNLVATDPVEKYIARLKAGEVIRSQIKVVEKELPIYLTYPTGWIYDSDFKEYRRKCLEGIKDFFDMCIRSPSEVLSVEG